MAFKQQNNTFTDSFVDSRLEYVDSFLKEIDTIIDFEKLRTDHDAAGEATATKTHVMHEDIFNSMHRT